MEWTRKIILEREDHKFPTHQNEQTRKDSDGSEISVESYSSNTYSDLINYYDTENEKDSQSFDHQPSEGMSSQNAKMMQVGNSGTDNSDSRFVKISRSAKDSDKDYEEIIANLQVENKRQVEETRKYFVKSKKYFVKSKKYFVKSKKYYAENKILINENKRYQDKMNEWKSKYEQLVAEFGKKGKRVKRSINRHI
jgi:hypothetical protein